MDDPQTTPRTRQRKRGVLAGAKAYLGGSSRSPSAENNNKELSRGNSEPALHAPVTPSSSSGKSKVRTKTGRFEEEQHQQSSPSQRKSSRSSSSRRSSIHLDPPAVDDGDGNGNSDPQTPRARQKIRRASVTGTNGSSSPIPTEGHRRDDVSVADSAMAVSPIKKKKKRPTSLGPLEGSSSTSRRSHRDEDVASTKSKESRVSSKEKKKRRSSLGPLLRDGAKRSSRATSSTPKPPRHSSVDALNEHLGDFQMPLEGALREPDESSSRRKSRTTVSNDGRIRRVQKLENSDGDDHEDGDDTRSKQSSSSKRSKMSSKSTKSTGTKKSSTSKKSTRDKDGKRMKSPRPSTSGSSSSLNYDSNHSEKSNRTERSVRLSARRAGKRNVSAEDLAEQVSTLSILESPKSVSEDKRPPTTSEAGNSKQQERKISDITNGFDDSFELLVREKVQESTAVATANLEDEVVKLNQKIVEMNEENLKAQFAAQSEAAKLRKELREEKLELQRSQTDRRELRAELRERDLIIGESDRKIQALEKAVESQLDKVDDLEEELRRANEEIFDLEGKLGDMERVLADSSAVETNALQKEKNFGDKRQERMERRLEEREMELEQREKKLRDDREIMAKEAQPGRDIEKLEQDNRMLLKALNRERAEAADKDKERDEEIKRLEQELKLAKMQSYSQVENGSTNDNIAKLLQDNVDLQQNFNEEKEKLASDLRKKDEIIASLEDELKNHADSGTMNGGSGIQDALAREMETLKGDLSVMKSRLEGAQRRNHLLEEDIDHWKSVNCNLEDEIADWKTQVATLRATYDDRDFSSANTHVSEGNASVFSRQREPSVAEMAMGRRDDDDDDDDHKTTASEPANSIANLWSKLTTPTSKRKTLDTDSVKEVIARTTFH